MLTVAPLLEACHSLSLSLLRRPLSLIGKALSRIGTLLALTSDPISLLRDTVTLVRARLALCEYPLTRFELLVAVIAQSPALLVQG